MFISTVYTSVWSCQRPYYFEYLFMLMLSDIYFLLFRLLFFPYICRFHPHCNMISILCAVVIFRPTCLWKKIVYYCIVVHIFFAFWIVCLVYQMLPFSLDCPFLIAPSVFYNVYLLYESNCYLNIRQRRVRTISWMCD
jgi:hypothetical protein